MKKYLLTVLGLVLFISLAACDRKSDKKNFLGGYGDITQGAYAGAYTSGFFEDDTYIYFGGFKINKISGKVIGICETPGCSHKSSDCVEFMYKERLFPGNDMIFYTEGTSLYELDDTGKKSLIAVFDTGSNGISLDKSVKIEGVMPVSDNMIYVLCQDGSCIYNLDTGEKVYAISSMVCGDDKNVYYYDSASGIFKVDTATMESNVITDTKLMYPCCCSNGILYCNTDGGSVYSIDRDNNIEVFLTERNKKCIMLGAAGEKLYYMHTDLDAVKKQYSFCDLYSCNTDGEDREKLNDAPLNPNMRAFVRDKALYLLDIGQFEEGNSVYRYDMDNKTWNTYMLAQNGNHVEAEQENEAIGEANHEELPIVEKSASMAAGFYSYSTDELTGNTTLIIQNNVPFKADGSEQKTIYQYYVEVEGYPEEGEIYIFALCGGIFQPLSVNGNEERLINSIPYKNKENMSAEIAFTIGNSSYANEVIIGTYFSDSMIENDFEAFSWHNEMVSSDKFIYKTVDGYRLEEKKTPEMDGNSIFRDIYTCETEEKRQNIEDVISGWRSDGFAVISDRIPIGVQRERWNIIFDENTPCYGLFCGNSGKYDIYLLVDDKPVLFYGEEYCLTCNIISEKDTVVFEMDINDIVDDNEKHIAKFLVYDYQTGMLNFRQTQIIQKKD
ncbi:MAG: DUF5050 domain-containing protein [Clostridium sp.]|nr:DUF5050 domain-containing protein [Clostridium sp.]MCM1208543.1 DUF5050 domain-containing protein [Ruminococcus sp.]